MLAKERHDEILKILELKGGIKSSKLIEILNVSLETIRRDFDILEKKGMLKKVHGGAVRERERAINLPHSQRIEKMKDEKIYIAEKAVNYINENETITLSGSTTNLEIARLIKSKISTLTVITNSLLIANVLANIEGINLVMIGGIYDKKEFSFLGDNACESILNFSADKSFISAGGISLKVGVTDFSEKEAQISKRFIEIANKVIVLADSSKIDSNSLIKICELDDIDFIISDFKLGNFIKDEYSKNGVQIKI
jgi:DeoR family transcriptional regulator, fructose operon transcriptional repressor